MLKSRDSHVWHPFTQHKLERRMDKIVHTKGASLYREDGSAVLDMISSWWVITHGHRHPAIMAAIQQATETFDQIIFADFTHEPAEVLAKALVELAPRGLSHVFYSDSGSTAVEVGIKMALGYFYNRGEARTRIAVLEHSYHGDTIGTMSAGARGAFNAAYGSLLFDVEIIPFPEARNQQHTLDCLEKVCKKTDMAAILVEPLILGAGGMKTYAPYVLREMYRIAQKYGILLLVDEVMTGWGRTGTIFACERADITPDILCTSKGLTAGALPLAATLCTSAIFDAHYSDDRSKTFFHSSSYTANPIACAAAVANIKIWRDEPVQARIDALSQMQAQKLQFVSQDKRFINLRQVGTIAALDLDVEVAGYFNEAGAKLRAFFKQNNVLLRPLGNVIYVMPPYCTTLEQLDHTYEILAEGVDWLTG